MHTPNGAVILTAPAEETAPASETAPADAPMRETAPASETAPAAPAIDLDTEVDSQEVDSAQRVYVDHGPRVPMSDGAIAVTQRERRSDGTLGAFEIAIVRVNPRTKQEVARRFDLASLKEWRKVMRAAGVKVLGD